MARDADVFRMPTSPPARARSSEGPATRPPSIGICKVRSTPSRRIVHIWDASSRGIRRRGAGTALVTGRASRSRCPFVLYIAGCSEVEPGSLCLVERGAYDGVPYSFRDLLTSTHKPMRCSMGQYHCKVL